MSELAMAEEVKAAQKVAWAAGDYDTVAQKIWAVGARTVERAGVGVGDDVLDVACGTGNATVPAAAAGANVTGLDLTPELLEIARARAADEGVGIEFVEGDAEELPFPAESFDVVLSTFGVMFAPRQEVVAAELARVLRPGGRLALANWTPEGSVGHFFRTTASYLPQRPGPPPVAWGSEERVRELLGDALELELEREIVELSFEEMTVENVVDFYEQRFGPVVMAMKMLDEEQRRSLHSDMVDHWEQDNVGGDGAVRSEAEYLAVLGRKA